jgi:uncharacterized membrane protein
VPRAAPLLLAATAVTWLAFVLLAPLALAHGYVVAPTLVYEAAGLICHQRPERSFHLAGIQLPVCARCFGLYASGAAGALAACAAPLTFARWGRTRQTPTALALALAALPTAATLGLEWAGLWQPRGVTRAVAALPLGALAGWLFARALAADGPRLDGPGKCVIIPERNAIEIHDR